MEDDKLSGESTYRGVGYRVTLIRSNVGDERRTFRVDIRHLHGLVAANTFISPGFYSTDAEAHKAAMELVELYIDRQIGPG